MVRQKNCTPAVSQQVILQCVPIKFVLTDMSVTHVLSHKHIIFYAVTIDPVTVKIANWLLIRQPEQ